MELKMLSLLFELASIYETKDIDQKILNRLQASS